MKEQEYIHKCLKDIEIKLKWGPRNDWTNQELTQLRHLIQEVSGISLSVSSLRRLYGMSTDYKKEYNPQIETKNALAKFLGYKDWYDYKKKNTDNSGITYKKLLSVIVIGILTLLVIITGVIQLSDHITHIFSIRTKQQPTFFFKGESLMSDYVPHTVIVNYNIQGLKKPVYVDWGDIPTDGRAASEPLELELDSGTVTHTYLTKNIYSIRLLDSKMKTLKQIKSFINTNDWECYAEQKLNLIRLDSLHFEQIAQKCADPDYLYLAGIDSTQPYRVYYRNNKDYGVDGNSFSFSTAFKMHNRKNYIECSHAQIEIIGSINGYLITFMSKGCAGAIPGIYLDTLYISGVTSDLTDFTISDQDWHFFNMSVFDKQIWIKLDNDTLLSTHLKTNVGNIIGIRFEFLGSGCIRNTQLEQL